MSGEAGREKTSQWVDWICKARGQTSKKHLPGCPSELGAELHWNLVESTSGFQPSGFVTGRRAVTTGRDPSVQYFSVKFRRPGTGRVDPSTGHPLPVRRRVDGSSKDKVNQRRTFSVSIWATRDDRVLWRIGKAAITAGFPLMNFNSE
ncbi:hypothetical protein FB451DRAFT_1185681 [Mycena latifolia]|nr:hypothetical protein FB451DRAFT_1185681 [Mycena latifolia]